jgi:hypothetical protein
MRDAEVPSRTVEFIAKLERDMSDLKGLRRTLALLNAERNQSKGNRRRVRRRTPRKSGSLIANYRSKPPLEGWPI